jgi:hypothetical protein
MQDNCGYCATIFRWLFLKRQGQQGSTGGTGGSFRQNPKNLRVIFCRHSSISVHPSIRVGRTSGPACTLVDLQPRADTVSVTAEGHEAGAGEEGR